MEIVRSRYEGLFVFDVAANREYYGMKMMPVNGDWHVDKQVRVVDEYCST